MVVRGAILFKLTPESKPITIENSVENFEKNVDKRYSVWYSKQAVPLRGERKRVYLVN